ncbi:MAG: lysozyme inhibitor LprI family protein [Gammaproteobacteria bacterium]|nr:lysozyme inhibitor LprI family protein [Gammaproteobacteria bacterium]
MILIFLLQNTIAWAGDVQRWKGEWRDKSTAEYDELFITNLTNDGFDYSNQFRESVDQPAGYTQLMYQGSTRFIDAEKIKAEDTDNNIVFTLTGHGEKWQRTIQMQVISENITRNFPVVRSVFKASFDCEKAGTAIEHAICQSEELANADQKLGKIYSKLRKNMSPEKAKNLRSSQRDWFKARNMKCTNNAMAETTCLVQAYGERLLILNKLSDPAYGAGEKLDISYATMASKNNASIWDDLGFKAAIIKLVGLSLSDVFAQTKPSIIMNGEYLVISGHYSPPQITIVREHEYHLVIDQSGGIWLGYLFIESVEGEGIVKSDIDLYTGNNDFTPAIISEWISTKRKYVEQNRR